MDMQQEIGSNGFIFNNEGKFLLVKRADNDEYFAGFWELPGGGVSNKETPQESLEREVLEECGLSVTVSHPLGVHNFYLKENTIKVAEITFLCKMKDPKQQVVLSFEHSDYKWVAKKDIESLELSNYIQQVVKDALANPIVKL